MRIRYETSPLFPGRQLKYEKSNITKLFYDFYIQ